MRTIRLALGIFIVVNGFWTQQWMFVLLGGFFTLMPLLNVGCCATGDCGVPSPNEGTENKTDEVTYEEIK